MTVIDGRRLRTDRSRERVLDAVVVLIEATGDIPTAQQLADHAGMSIRSVFRLFDDMEELYSEAIRARAATLRERYVAPSVSLPLIERIDRIVEVRTSVHEEITPVRRVVVRLLHRAPELEPHLITLMDELRAQVAAVFAPELEAAGEPLATVRLHGLDAALSWEFWNRLRSVQGLDSVAARSVVAETVTSLLER